MTRLVRPQRSALPLARCLSFRISFLTMQPAPHTLKLSVGAMASAVSGATSRDGLRFANRPHVLRCRACKRDNRLTAGTVMQDTRTPLSTWFWGAYLVSTDTAGISAVRFQRQLGIKTYETAFRLLHKLRAGMVRPDSDRIGQNPDEHVEIDEAWVGGKTRGLGEADRSEPCCCRC